MTQPVYKPNQVTFSYSSPCKQCPSFYGDDPEAEMFRSWPFEERIKQRFLCAWRGRGFCYGNAKSMFYGHRKWVEKEVR